MFAADANMIGADGSWDDGSCYLPQEHSAGPFLSTTGMNMMIASGVQGAPAGANPLSQAPIAQLGGGGAATSQQPQVFYAVPADQYHAMQNNVNSNIVLGNSNMNGGQTGAMIMATAPPGGPSSTTTNGVGSAMGGNSSYAAMERNKWMLRGQEELLDPSEDGAYHYGDVMDQDGSLPMDAIESYQCAASTLQLDQQLCQQLPATSRPPGGREETPQEYFQFQMMPQCRAGKRKIDRADLLGHSSVLDHQQVQLQDPGMYDAGTNGQKGSSPAPPGLERGGSCAAKGGNSGAGGDSMLNSMNNEGIGNVNINNGMSNMNLMMNAGMKGCSESGNKGTSGGITNGGGGFFYTNGKDGMNDCTGTEKQQLIDFDAAVMGRTGGNKGKFGTNNGKCWGKGANKNAQDFFDHGDRYFSNKGGRDAGFGGKGGKGGKYNGSGYGDKDSGYFSDNTAAMSGGSKNCTLTAGGPSNCNPNPGSRSGTSSTSYASHEQYSSGKDCDARSQKSGSVSVCKSDGEVEQDQDLGGVDLVEFPPLSVNKTSPGKTPEKAKLHKASKSSTAATKSPFKPGSNHTGGDHPGASVCGGSLTPASASVASTKDSVGRRAIPVVLTKKMSMKLAPGEASTANDGSGTGTSKSGSQSTKSTVTSTCADEPTTSITSRAFEDSGSCCSEDMEEPSKPPAQQAKQVPQDDQDYSSSNVASGGIGAQCAAVGEDDKNLVAGQMEIRDTTPGAVKLHASGVSREEEAQSALLKAGVETPDDVWAGRVTQEIVSEPQSEADPGTSASSAAEELDQDTLMSPGSNSRNKSTDPFPSMPIDMRGGGTRSRGSSAAGSYNHGDNMIVGAGGSGPRDQYEMNGSATTAAYGGGNGGRAGPHQSRYQQDHVGSSQSHVGNQSQSHLNAGQGRFQDGGNSYSYNAGAGPNGNRGNSFEGQVHMNNGPMGAARGGGNNDYYAQNRGGGQKGGRVLEQDNALNQQRNNGQGYNNRNNDENGLQCSEIISPNSVCRFWWRGNCVKGKYCEWAHQLPTGCTEKPPPVNRFNTGPAERQWNGRNYPRGPNPANANSGPVVLGNPNPANGPVVANGQMNRGPPPGNSNSCNANMSTGPAGAGGNSRGAAGPNDGLGNPNPKNMPLCTFWKTGRCENGPGCPWAHPNPGRIHDPCQNVRAAVQDQKALPPPAASQAASVVGRTAVTSRAASMEIPSSVAATQNVGAAANPAASPTQNNPQHLQAQAQAEPAERPQSTRDNAVVVDQKNLIGQAEQQQLQRPVAPQQTLAPQQQPILAQRVGGQELQVQPPAQLRAGGPGLVGESTTAQVSVNYKPRDMLVLNEHWDLIICGNRISSFILLIVAVAVGNYMLIWPHSSGAGSSQ